MASDVFDTALGANYRLISSIGVGASGEVWLAVDNRTGEQVAAKLLRGEHTTDRELVTRFVAERSILMELRDASIVAVRDLVVDSGHLAIVMDYLDGGTLREKLRENGTFDPHAATRIAALLLDAVAVAHSAGIVHRDIKPDNVLLTSHWAELAPGSIRLSDFGIASILEGSARSTTGIVGTPEYMAPELIVTGHCDRPADVYGIGVLWYELLAGRTPFAGPGTDFTIANRHVNARPPQLDLPAELTQALDSLLAKDPGKRPPAALAAARLRRLAEQFADLPALPPAGAPEVFEDDQHPATIAKAMPAPTEPVQAPVEPVAAAPAPDLGPGGGETVFRPMPVRARPARDQPADASVQVTGAPERPPWRNPRFIAAAAGAVLVTIGAGIFFFAGQGATKSHATSSNTAIQATQLDHPTPTGLTIARSAEYQPETHKVKLTISYTAQNSPLSGPFLEVIPGLDKGDQCPAVSWDGGDQQHNLPASTGIDVDCGWSIDVGQVPAQGSQTVSATVAVSASSQQQLQTWLNNAAAATTGATSDSQVTTTAYPVQRMQSVQVSVPASAVTESTLGVTLVPVWPSGADALNPLLESPSVGNSTAMLQDIAGGTSGVKFSDGCSGALAVSPNGLVVTTLTQSPQCVVDAQVGNFTGLTSNTFAIVTRGG